MSFSASSAPVQMTGTALVLLLDEVAVCSSQSRVLLIWLELKRIGPEADVELRYS